GLGSSDISPSPTSSPAPDSGDCDDCKTIDIPIPPPRSTLLIVKVLLAIAFFAFFLIVVYFVHIQTHRSNPPIQTPQTTSPVISSTSSSPQSEISIDVDSSSPPLDNVFMYG
ncbi:hypothetical protein MKW92_030474, partial [Papaver armeniacum]